MNTTENSDRDVLHSAKQKGEVRNISETEQTRFNKFSQHEHKAAI
jgi:hypothetical protein